MSARLERVVPGCRVVLHGIASTSITVYANDRCDAPRWVPGGIEGLVIAVRKHGTSTWVTVLTDHGTFCTHRERFRVTYDPRDG